MDTGPVLKDLHFGDIYSNSPYLGSASAEAILNRDGCRCLWLQDYCQQLISET